MRACVEFRGIPKSILSLQEWCAMPTDHSARLLALERSVRRMGFAFVGLALLALVLAGLLATSLRTPEQVLQVSELIVTDEEGVVRVRIGGDLPGEKRGQGQEGAAGILLFDGTGDERGGYVTLDSSGHVGLTLDGRDAQSAVFRADTTGATTLRLWNAQEMFEIKADEDGARYSVLRNREIVLQEPAFADPPSTVICRGLQSVRGEYEPGIVLQACRERMTESACSACLGSQ